MSKQAELELAIKKYSIEELEERHNMTVVKHHELITARQSLSLSAQILLNYQIAKIDSRGNKSDKLKVEMKEDDLLHIINSGGVRRISSKKDILKITNELSKVDTIYFPVFDDNGRVVKHKWFSWVTGLEYDTEKKTWTWRINSVFDSFLLNLGKKKEGAEKAEQFIQYAWVLHLTFTSHHSERIYTNILKRLHSKKRKQTILFDIDELKRICNLEGSYKKFYDFKNRVLDIVQKDINESPISSITIEIKKAPGPRVNRKIKNILIEVTRRDDIQKLPEGQPIEALHLRVDEISIKWKQRPSEKTINGLLDKGYTSEEIIRGAVYTAQMIEESPNSIKNPVGYFVKAVELAKSQAQFKFDQEEEEKKKKQATKEAKKIIDTKYQEKQDLRQKIKAERFQAKSKLAIELMEADPALEKEAIDHVLNTTLFRLKKYQEVKDQPSFLATVRSYIFKTYPAKFAVIDEQFEEKLKKVGY